MMNQDTYDALRCQERVYQKTRDATSFERLPLLDVSCRNRMIDWMYSLIDFCGLQRATVEVSINYMDRWLSVVATPTTTRTEFQLVAMTCLYVAIKIHEVLAIKPDVLAQLSGGKYIVEDFERCERSLLPALDWMLNPPTTMCFVKLSVEADDRLNERERTQVVQQAQAQLEGALRDFPLCCEESPSVLASVVLYDILRDMCDHTDDMMTEEEEDLMHPEEPKGLHHDSSSAPTKLSALHHSPTSITRTVEGAAR
eukprot:CAMPEP_0194030786 /NCGR_PEP_ID=MMETSP0009_2-20130614/4131_1 /TAXON_ID=210454 /ORGANISM="Grammatophora oceanica, Strain CCMP 410" /LENGTH=254 /DNA_ID=CAMNT_0038670785 /DNA_START=171 /DNA_END=935 /DNA_ORIENTATION=+